MIWTRAVMEAGGWGQEAEMRPDLASHGMEGNRGDKKGCKVHSLGSGWGVASDRNPTETTSSLGYPGSMEHTGVRTPGCF